MVSVSEAIEGVAPGWRIALSNAVGRAKTGVLKSLLSAIHYSGAGRLGAAKARGRGIIFTLHSVSPTAPDAFDPNGILRVTPKFLEEAIAATQAAGYDIVSLDEAARRMAQPDAGKPFACFTFDDGYRGNRDHAYPIFKRLCLPFAIYIPTDYPLGLGELWWLVLEGAVRKADALDVTIAGQQSRFVTRTPAQKIFAFNKIYWQLRKLPEAELRAQVRRIAAAAGYDASTLCSDEIMTWEELRALAADPLVTLGAHTRRHLALAKLPAEEARAEAAESVAILEAELGRPCRHFSYPYGDATSAGPRDFALLAEIGVATAVTTRKGLIGSADETCMTGLPRVSLNGDFQKARYVSAYLSGVPFALLALAGGLKARLRRPRGEAATPDAAAAAPAGA